MSGFFCVPLHVVEGCSFSWPDSMTAVFIHSDVDAHLNSLQFSDFIPSASEGILGPVSEHTCAHA